MGQWPEGLRGWGRPAVLEASAAACGRTSLSAPTRDAGDASSLRHMTGEEYGTRRVLVVGRTKSDGGEHRAT